MIWPGTIVPLENHAFLNPAMLTPEPTAIITTVASSMPTHLIIGLDPLWLIVDSYAERLDPLSREWPL
jgi:hypothetical protein